MRSMKDRKEKLDKVLQAYNRMCDEAKYCVPVDERYERHKFLDWLLLFLSCMVAGSLSVALSALLFGVMLSTLFQGMVDSIWPVLICRGVMLGLAVIIFRVLYKYVFVREDYVRLPLSRERAIRVLEQEMKRIKHAREHSRRERKDYGQLYTRFKQLQPIIKELGGESELYEYPGNFHMMVRTSNKGDWHELVRGSHVGEWTRFDLKEEEYNRLVWVIVVHASVRALLRAKGQIATDKLLGCRNHMAEYLLNLMSDDEVPPYSEAWPEWVDLFMARKERC